MTNNKPQRYKDMKKCKNPQCLTEISENAPDFCPEHNTCDHELDWDVITHEGITHLSGEQKCLKCGKTLKELIKDALSEPEATKGWEDEFSERYGNFEFSPAASGRGYNALKSFISRIEKESYDRGSMEATDVCNENLKRVEKESFAAGESKEQKLWLEKIKKYPHSIQETKSDTIKEVLAVVEKTYHVGEHKEAIISAIEALSPQTEEKKGL